MVSLLVVVTAFSQPHVEKMVDSLIVKMTFEDKVGQLNQLDGRMDMAKLEAMIRAGQISSLMNIVDPVEIDRLQKIAVEESPAGIPILFSRDVVHGFHTMLPIPLGQACSFDPDLVREGARMAAVEATEYGIRWGFAPMIDVSRDSRWGRIAESFGEDPLLNARMGLSQVEGYQNGDLSSPTSLAACAKHFVGYGAAEGGRDYNGAYLTERQLRDTYLVPFRQALTNGCASVMTSFQDNDGLQVSANKWLLHDVLREEWGWDGVVVSDYGSIGQLVRHGIAETRKDAARLGLNCGSDMDMSSKVFLAFAKELVEEGAVEMSVIDNAVRNVLRLKVRLGMFKDPYTRKSTGSTASQAHLDIAEKAAEESVVLLKNNGILPLKKDAGLKILVTGPLANAHYDQLGTWNMDGDTTLTVTPAMAFLGLEGCEVVYVPGLDYSRDRDRSQWKKVSKAARKADVILAFMGEEQIVSGEAHSLADINLYGEQKDFVKMLHETGKPVVVTVMAGRALTVEEEVGLSDAFIYSFHPGTMGGKALADVIFGDVNPSGKLPITFPRHVGQIPIYYNAFRHGRALKTNRSVPIDQIPRSGKQSVLGHICTYLDYGSKPLFPFGYGLSYADFSFGELSVEAKQLKRDGVLRFTVPVTNSGPVDGQEVVQVYVRDVAASLSRPVLELKDFKKVHIPHGETVEVQFEIPVNSLGFHDINCRYVVEPGKFKVTVSNCSDFEYCPTAQTFTINVVE